MNTVENDERNQGLSRKECGAMPSLIDGHPAKGDRRVGSETPPRIQ
jgi:hypothetical protein